MYATLPRLAIVLACLLAFSAARPPLSAAQEPPAPVLQVTDGLLTARLERTPLGEVARLLAEQAGVEFVFADDALRQIPVSVSFQGRSLAEGLTEMAERFNTVYIFDRAQRLKVVHILPKGEPSPGAPPAAAAPRQEEAAPPPPATVIITPPPAPGGPQATRLPGLPPGVQVEIRPGGPEAAPPPAQPGAGPLPTAPPAPETPPGQSPPPDQPPGAPAGQPADAPAWQTLPTPEAPSTVPPSPPPAALRGLREPGGQ